MRVKAAILSILEQQIGETISVSELAGKLGIPGNAVQEAIQTLRAEGYRIHDRTDQGYCLDTENEIFSPQSITAFLKNDFFYRIQVSDELPSTNTELKRIAEKGEPEGAVLIAKQQTEGRGRRGRSFYSPDRTGIYMSILLRPRFSPEEALSITTAAAVAVTSAIEEITGKDTRIKWVNDVFYQKKKVCGILTEATMDFEARAIQYAILGIGINLCPPADGFPEELSGIAGALYEPGTLPANLRNHLTASILNHFYELYKVLPSKAFMEEYIRRSFVIGKKVAIHSPVSVEEGTVLGIDENAGLLVRLQDGTEKRLNSGEISLREI